MMFCFLILTSGLLSVIAEETVSSYSNPVGTSYTVPLTNSYSAPKPENSVTYSVSADDLERSSDLDGSSSNSYVAPVYSVGSSSAYSAYPSYSKTLTSSYSAVSSGGNSVDAGSAGSSSSEHVAQEKSASESHAHAHAGERNDVSSAYQAPAETYNAAPVSTGNLYYYYYPVQAQPIVEKSDNEVDPLVAILLPITVIVGFLALLSILNATFNSGRSAARAFGRESTLDSTFGSFSALQSEVDNMLAKYYDVLEDESCMDRLVCELGTKAQNLSGKEYLMKALDWIIPSTMTRRIETFKLAVNEGYDVQRCGRYACDRQKLIDISRRK